MEGRVWVFGSNREGQAGIASGEETLAFPTLLTVVDPSLTSRIVCSQKQTFLLTTEGQVLSAGENDGGELGRSGKRSLLFRLDAVEAFSVTDVALGDGFVILVLKDGRCVSWGKNEMGQLGVGNREAREKPKLTKVVQEGILQISCGAQHVVALSTNGTVYTWGANRKGQLGDGQLTSSFLPKPLPQLKHRPVVMLSCGENHTLAMTIGGTVYAWGENSLGQLGLGDDVMRLRPEPIRSLRVSRARKISTGKSHSMVVTPGGLLFAFGSNAFGQLGLGQGAERVVLSPTVVEKLKGETIKVIDVACGNAHTLALACYSTSPTSHLFGFGLNTSGQLGLGHTSSPIIAPTLVEQFREEGSAGGGGAWSPIGCASGWNSLHSFVFGSGVPLGRVPLPSVDLPTLHRASQRLLSAITIGSSNVEAALRPLRETVADAFSSSSVLNASFRLQTQDGSAVVGSSDKLCIDLQQVRLAYESLLSTQCEPLLSTLGRATLHMAEQLKEVPSDDAENLSCFLITLENPLLLRPGSNSTYITLTRICTGILALPKESRRLVFGWLKAYPSEFFARVLHVLQNFITFALATSSHSIDPSPAVLILEQLYLLNRDIRIVPDSFFFNSSVMR